MAKLKTLAIAAVSICAALPLASEASNFVAQVIAVRQEDLRVAAIGVFRQMEEEYTRGARPLVGWKDFTECSHRLCVLAVVMDWPTSTKCGSYRAVETLRGRDNRQRAFEHGVKGAFSCPAQID